MNRFKLVTILLSCALTVFVGCQVGDQWKLKQIETSDTGPGTGDGGGGTGVERKVFEQYIQSSEQILKNNPQLSDLLQLIEKSETGFSGQTGIAKALRTVLEHKTWLFIPADVKAIDSSKMDLGTNQNAYEQFAFQNDQEIWINDSKFQAMTEDSRLALLIHEMVMDIKVKSLFLVLANETETPKSLFISFCKAHQNSLNQDQKKRFCAEVKENETSNNKLYSLLKSTDYPAIRQATSAILAVKEQSDFKKIYTDLYAAGFSEEFILRPLKLIGNASLAEAKALLLTTQSLLADSEKIDCQARKGVRLIQKGEKAQCQMTVEQKEFVTIRLTVNQHSSSQFQVLLDTKVDAEGVESRPLVLATKYQDMLEPLEVLQITDLPNGEAGTSLTFKSNFGRVLDFELRSHSANESWLINWNIDKVIGFEF